MNKLIVWVIGLVLVSGIAIGSGSVSQSGNTVTNDPGASASTAGLPVTTGSDSGSAYSNTPNTIAGVSVEDVWNYEPFNIQSGTSLPDNDPGLQGALNALGYTDPDPDRNIRGFQRDHDLSDDGDAGPITGRKLNDIYDALRSFSAAPGTTADVSQSYLRSSVSSEGNTQTFEGTQYTQLLDSSGNSLGWRNELTGYIHDTPGGEFASGGASIYSLSPADLNLIGRVQTAADKNNFGDLSQDDLERAVTILSVIEGSDLPDYITASDIYGLQLAASGARGQKAELDKLLSGDLASKSREDIARARELAKKVGSGSDIRNTNRARNENTRRTRLTRIQNSAQLFNDYVGFLGVPSPGARALEDLAEQFFGGPKGFDPTVLTDESSTFAKMFGLGFEETFYDAICRDNASEYFIQDYPGHFVAGGSYPNLGSILYINGRRTEYTAYDWTDETTYRPDGKPPNWFPLTHANGTTEPRGYLYKISWQAGNPYQQYQIDEMSAGQLSDLGLNENGSITYSVTMDVDPDYNDGTTTITEFDFEDTLPHIEPDSIESKVFVFYDRAHITEICLEFDNYRYDGNSKKKCSSVVVQDLSSQVPESFAFSEATGPTASTGDTGGSSGCSLPPELC